MSEVLSQVIDLRSTGNYSDAREIARAACAESAEPALLIEFGRLAGEAGHHDASAEAFERAMATSTGAIQARAAAGLVRARRAQGRTQDARELLMTELVRSPSSADLLIEAGEMAAELGDFTVADAHLRCAVA